jgi:hypothetical protein
MALEETKSGERWLGMLAGSHAVILVELEQATPDTLVICNDETIELQTGPRPIAYSVLHKRIVGYIRDRQIDHVVIKGSAGSQQAATTGMLESAEVRGVVAAAAACAEVDTSLWNKASASRRKGHRKVDDYVNDEDFWVKQRLGGRKLRKGSREAAFAVFCKMGLGRQDA